MAAQQTGRDVEINDAEPDTVEVQYQDPFQFPTTKKWMITVMLALCTLTSTFCSSIFSATIVVTAKEFNTTEEVTLLGVSLFVLGFALGPMLWGPLSELLGRKPTIFTGYFIMGLLQIPTALSPTLAGVLICRFLAGCFGASPVAVVSAAYADFWDPAHRGVATAVYSASAYAGPTLGPVVGSFVTESYLGWRWTAWLVLIMVGGIGIPCFVFVPETYAPVLKERAARRQGLAVTKKNPFKGFLRKHLAKPVLLLGYEPMLDIMTIYIAVVYAIQYLTFFAFPYAFAERGWTRQIGSLSFLSMLVGILTSCCSISLYSRKHYVPRLKARGKVLPEDRLPPIMLGSVVLPIGLFWFAWTSSPQISWVPQMISGFFIGSGIALVFSNGIAYLIDIYGRTASASAMSANCLVRSAAAAGLPLAGPSMYRSLGTAWATSTLAFICIALIPAPFVFYRYGERFRAISKYAPVRTP